MNINIKKFNLNFRRLLPLFIIGIAFCVAIILIATKPEAKPVGLVEKAWLVNAEKIIKKSQSPSIKLYGKVSSLWSSELKASSETDIKKINFIEGDSFKKNQVLIQLDDVDAKLKLVERDAELREISASFEFAEKEVKRFAKLAEKKVISQSSLDNAEAKFLELKAKRLRLKALYDRAKLELDRCNIKAPFDGRVSKLYISPGQRVRVGEPLINVYDTSEMILRAQIPNRFLSIIQNSQREGKVLRVIGQLDGVQITAKLRSLSGLIAEGSGGAEGIFEIQAINDYLHQGRFVKLDLILPELENAISLPQEAIYGNNKIYRVDKNNRIRGLFVERVGEMRIDDDNTRVIVKSPKLKSGEKVITTQLPNAIDGLLIRESLDK
tara:strand:- start:7962 stop:9104 length:1143 start_codon:yes stop_codon:yes gene_type:complete